MVFLRLVHQMLQLLYLGNQIEVELLADERDLNLRQALQELVLQRLRLRE